jgi:hypothetical protein
MFRQAALGRESAAKRLARVLEIAVLRGSLAGATQG